MQEFTIHMDEYLPLRDVVFKTLRQAILHGELKPGERLMEITLAQRLGVSRTPIREAIRMLELEGLVTMIPRKGAMVAQITEKSLRDVLEVRRALDALSVELACERITEEELNALDAACESVRQAMESKDVTRIASADVDFHNIIFQAADNERLTAMISNLAEQMYRYRYEYIKDERNYDTIIQEHEAIRDALHKREKSTAADAVKNHIDTQEKSIILKISSAHGSD